MQMPGSGSKKEFTNLANHLENYKDAAIKRQDQGDYWWELRGCDYYSEFEKPKIIIPTIVQQAAFAYDQNSFYSNDKTSIIPAVICIFSKCQFQRFQTVFVFLKRICSTKQGGYFEQKPMYILQIPIRRIDPALSTESAVHAAIVEKVPAHAGPARSSASRAKSELDDVRHTLAVEIGQVDAEIDALVYRLYGLTADEIAVVESR